MDTKKITIGISSCLLGENVRYDGVSKKEESLIVQLEKIVQLLPICPEVEIGIPVPRERLLLVGSIENCKMIGEESKKNWSDAMQEFSRTRILKSDFKEISGLILKSKSPSCGVQSTEVFDGENLISENGTGLFAAVVMQIYPLLPNIDELALRDSHLFKHFINSVIEYAKKK